MDLKRTALTAAALGALAVPSTASAAPGDLDASFGQGGSAAVQVTTTTMYAHNLAVDAQSRPVLTGALAGFAIERLTADGAPDRSFGPGGVAFPPNGARALGRAIDVLGDGRIVAGGVERATNQSPDGQVYVARTSASGAIDTSFGQNGVVRGGLAPNGVVGLAGRPGGGVNVLAFSATAGPNEQPVVRRLGSSGAAEGDVVLPLASSGATRVRPTAQGGFLVAGRDADGIAVVRYTAAGTPDPAFGGGDGVAEGPAAAAGHSDLAVDPEGRILITTGRTVGSDVEWQVARFTASGVLDTTFGSGGVASVGGVVGPTSPGHIAVDEHGIVVAGGRKDTGSSHTTVVRLTHDGAVDSEFGRVDFDNMTQEKGLAIAPNGRILLSTSTERPSGGYDAVVVALEGGSTSGADGEDVDGSADGSSSTGGGTLVAPAGPITTTITSGRSGTRRITVGARFLSARPVGGAIRMRVSFPRGIRGVATLKLRRRGKAKTLVAQRTFTLRGADSMTVRVPLTKAGKKLMRSGRRVSVTASLTVTGR